MKKFAPIAALILTAALFASCKKDYTCTCVTSVTGSADVTNKIDLGKQTKKDAKNACDQKSTTTSAGGMTATVKCSLD